MEIIDEASYEGTVLGTVPEIGLEIAMVLAIKE